MNAIEENKTSDKPQEQAGLAAPTGSPTPPVNLKLLAPAKIIKGVGARAHLNGLEVIIVAGDLTALKKAWGRFIPEMEIMESRCQSAIVVAADDWLENTVLYSSNANPK